MQPEQAPQESKSLARGSSYKPFFWSPVLHIPLLLDDGLLSHQSLWVGGSYSIQLIMSSSVYIVTLWPPSALQGPCTGEWFSVGKSTIYSSIPGLQSNSSIRSCQRPHRPSLSQVLHVPLRLLHHMARVAERLTQKCGTMAEPALWAQLTTRNLTNYLVNVSKPRSWPNLTYVAFKTQVPNRPWW